MRAAISSTTYDPAGHVELDCLADTTHGETARRLNRVATLDGGAVVNDFGQSEADRTIELRWRPRSAADEARVERLETELYALRQEFQALLARLNDAGDAVVNAQV